MEWLSPELLAPSGLAGLAVLSIIRGWLVPRWVVRAQAEQSSTNLKLWQQTAEANAAARDLAVKQSEQLLAFVATVEPLLRSIDQQLRELS